MDDLVLLTIGKLYLELTNYQRIIEAQRVKIAELFSEIKPEQYTRIIVHRLIGKNSYVDVLNYFEEQENKMTPLNNIKGITHWMPLPDAPKDL